MKTISLTIWTNQFSKATKLQSAGHHERITELHKEFTAYYLAKRDQMTLAAAVAFERLGFEIQEASPEIMQPCECGQCKNVSYLLVNKENFEKWSNREMLAQNAFPKLSRADRELLISKTCGKCWTKMFGAA